MLKIMTIICFVAIVFIFLFMAYLLDNKDKWHINADGQIKFSKKGLTISTTDAIIIIESEVRKYVKKCNRIRK